MNATEQANRSVIDTSLIPDHARRDIGEAALDGLLSYKRWLDRHPEEKREFEERCAEVRKRYPSKGRKK